jgi:hypothetical protein
MVVYKDNSLQLLTNTCYLRVSAKWKNLTSFGILNLIAQWYSAGLRAGLPEFRDQAGAGNFPLCHRVQTGSGAHPASYPVGTRGSFPSGKWPGCEADHSPPSSAEVNNAWSYTSTPQYAFMAWCYVMYIPYSTNGSVQFRI